MIWKLTFFNTNKVSASERKGIIEKNPGTDPTNFVHKFLRFRLYFNSVKLQTLVICFPNGGTAAGLKHALNKTYSGNCSGCGMADGRRDPGFFLYVLHCTWYNVHVHCTFFLDDRQIVAKTKGNQEKYT
jgi:hypothetical protein